MLPDTSPHSDSLDESLQFTPQNWLQELLFALSKRAKGFIKANRELWLAKRTCTFYLGKRDKDAHRRCQHALNTRFRLHPTRILNFLESSLGVELLQRLSDLFRWSNHDESQQALKDMLVNTASKPEGLSLITLLKEMTTFPLNKDQVVLLSSQFEQLLQATQSMTQTIQKLASIEAESFSEHTSPQKCEGNEIEGNELNDDLSNLSIDKSSNHTTNRSFTQHQQSIWPNNLHQGENQHPANLLTRGSQNIQQNDLLLYDSERDRTLRVVTLSPEFSQDCTTQSIPVILLSHGLGSNPEDMMIYAKFLASHGCFVAALQHPGSDTRHVQNMLDGQTPDVFHFTEFIDRPLDVTFLLNYLEKYNQSKFNERLNLKSVGVMGHSFGGYTALALAGGAINFDKLETACDPSFNALNLSLFLQCPALRLPRKPYDLSDRRIQAIFVLDSVGSEVFGRDGLQGICIPVFFVAGSDDRTTPAVLEQIRIFPWLTTHHRYLCLIKGKSHITDIKKIVSVLELNVDIPKDLLPQNTDILDEYIKTFSVTFFKVHIEKNVSYQAYLTSKYAQSISRNEYPLALISAVSSQKLESALEDIGAQLVREHSDELSPMNFEDTNIRDTNIEVPNIEGSPRINGDLGV